MVLGAGGIGQAFAQYCKDVNESVYLLGRNERSDNIPPEIKLDLENEQSLPQIAAFICKENIQTLVNTLGILHSPTHFPEKTINQLDEAWFNESLKVNCLSSLILLKHLNQRLAADSTFRFIALSARVGSISDNRVGGWLSYRVSKAALNMGLKTAAIEWTFKHKNAVIVGYHPGTVDTNLSRPFQANVKKLFSPYDASACLYSFIQSLKPEMSGGFYDWQKERIPY